jgi:hypothetical protein
VLHNLGHLAVGLVKLAGDLARLVLQLRQQLIGMCWIQANQQLHVDMQAFADNVVHAQLRVLFQPTLAGCCQPVAGG